MELGLISLKHQVQLPLLPHNVLRSMRMAMLHMGLHQLERQTTSLHSRTTMVLRWLVLLMLPTTGRRQKSVQLGLCRGSIMYSRTLRDNIHLSALSRTRWLGFIRQDMFLQAHQPLPMWVVVWGQLLLERTHSAGFWRSMMFWAMFYGLPDKTKQEALRRQIVVLYLRMAMSR